MCVADLFAGSGSLGLEAVSRGASRCVFVERDRAALGVLRHNLDLLQAEPWARIVAADAWKWPVDAVGQPGEPWGLVFVDPPYRDSRDSGPGGRVSALLARLSRGAWLDSTALLVLHHERRVRYEPASGEHWALADRREYGNAAVSFFRLVETTGIPGGAAVEARTRR